MGKHEIETRLEQYIGELGLSEDEIRYWERYEIDGLGSFYHELGEAPS